MFDWIHFTRTRALFQPQQHLQLTNLERLKAGRGAEPITKREEILRRECFHDFPLLR